MKFALTVQWIWIWRKQMSNVNICAFREEKNVRTILVLLACFSFLTGPSAAQNAESGSVCGLFADLPSHSGQTVEVRGKLIVSRHGWALWQGDCPYSFSADGVKWPTALSLRRAPLSEADKDNIVRFEKSLCFLNEATPDQLGLELTATFVGVLSIRTNYLPRVGYGGQMRGGFGPFGTYPAELAYSRIKEVVIREKQAEPSRAK
jgi:hypothetical protein